MTCSDCKFYDGGSALDPSPGDGKCCYNPPTSLPVPAATGVRVHAVHPPCKPKQKACCKFEPEISVAQ